MLKTVWDGLYLRKLALMDTIKLSNWCLMIKSKSSNLNAWDIHGWTPFMKPCIYGHTYVIKGFLLFLEKMEENCGLEKRKYDGNLFQRGLLIVFLSLTPLGFLFPFSSALKLQQEMHMRISFFNYSKKEDSIQLEKSLFLEFHFIVGWNWQRLTVKLNSFFGLLVGLKSLSKCADSGPKEASKPAGDRFLHFRKTNLATN